MHARHSRQAQAASTEEPTPEPASAVKASSPSDGAVESLSQRAGRRAAILEHFANPSPQMRAMDAAWEEALALYGDEDSDAWVSALEDGTHPLCRVGMLQRYREAWTQPSTLIQACPFPEGTMTSGLLPPPR